MTVSQSVLPFFSNWVSSQVPFTHLGSLKAATGWGGASPAASTLSGTWDPLTTVTPAPLSAADLLARRSEGEGDFLRKSLRQKLAFDNEDDGVKREVGGENKAIERR